VNRVGWKKQLIITDNVVRVSEKSLALDFVCAQTSTTSTTSTMPSSYARQAPPAERHQRPQRNATSGAERG